MWNFDCRIWIEKQGQFGISIAEFGLKGMGKFDFRLPEGPFGPNLD
jgi:hypothetical protein